LTNKKKILIISAVFPPEPVFSANLSRDLAEMLSKENEVTVLCPKPTRPHGFKMNNNFSPDNYSVFRLNSFSYTPSKIIGRFFESHSFGKHCQTYINNNFKNIDVIYANTFPLLAQYYTVRTAKKFNIPIIIHVMDVYPESLSNKIPIFSSLINRILLPIDKFVLKNATKVVAISNRTKKYLIKTRKILDNKIIVVLNYQDETKFTEYKLSNKPNNIINDPFTYMYMGNIGPVAGLDLLLQAFAQTDLKNIRLVIAGSGSMKEALKSRAYELELNTIEFWDVAEGKVPEIQNQADVMLLPIKKGAAFSSVPSKLPAYMFSEKPIIACVDAGSDTELAIKSSNCGWVIPSEDVESLTTKINEISKISNTELCKKGKNGFEYALKNFSKNNNLKQLVKTILE
jgi:glycosyltransferase involved in cell wall biosynthesis